MPDAFTELDPQQVERPRRGIGHQFQRLKRRARDARRRREVICGAHRHQPQRRQRIGRLAAGRKRGGDHIERAIATGGHHGIDTFGQGFGDEALGITLLPGHAHIKRDAAPAQGMHGFAHGGVTCGFAVEDQAPVGKRHAASIVGGRHFLPW